MPDLASEKQALRDRLRFRRRHFVANLDDMARLTAFRVLPAPLADLLAAHAVIGGYAPLGDEPDLLAMLAPAAAALALPHHMARDAVMGFRRWQPGDALIKGPWGTPQPADSAEPTTPDLILCPLVGFDRAGRRLGQGGGHYDRFLADNAATPRIGVAWSVQEVDAVPVEATDMRLDAVLTEQEFILCGDRL